LREYLPTIQIVDLREEFKKRNFSIFSLVLQNKIKERLENKEQVILFVNQRGMASAVVCRDCGYTERCPHCEVSLKLHRYYQNTAGERLVCHYCNYSKAPELLCTECQSPYIKHMGVGTQRVEEDLKKMFPDVRTVRADRDTTASGEGFAGIYRDFLDHQYDVLIGTQMIAKGLDFAKVSLIGIVLADVGLHIPDFRSSERLFQIITQVSGRCGRREKSGEVILQTYNPDHSTFKKVASYDYKGFIEKELEMREELNYPPFNQMIKFTVVGDDPKKLTNHIQTEQEVLEDIFKVNNLPVKILSAPALIPKMSNRYYYHVLLRAEDPTIIFKHWKIPRGWRVDIDPIHTT
ncbi:primosomal protein N', partial [Candidatus Pacearchaeota archaeon]|nr:primosomal protein N' [Candidatus Pacearchaeota archaeon]